jgi:hypothetical protein
VDMQKICTQEEFWEKVAREDEAGLRQVMERCECFELSILFVVLLSRLDFVFFFPSVVCLDG